MPWEQQPWKGTVASAGGAQTTLGPRPGTAAVGHGEPPLLTASATAAVPGHLQRRAELGRAEGRGNLSQSNIYRARLSAALSAGEQDTLATRLPAALAVITERWKDGRTD